LFWYNREMKKFLRKIFGFINRSKSILLIIFLCSLAVGLMLPSTVKAQLGDFVQGLLLWLPSAMIGFILSVVMWVLTGLLYLANALLDWGIGNPFGISLTNPATNPIINVGWTLLRDLTNMVFILGLAYIGLATALNLGGFNTKKTFFNLLLIALLINFTPVICGVIVDATNIIANFFLNSISFGDFVEVAKNQQGSIISALLSPTQLRNEAATLLLQTAILMVFLAIAIFVFIIYAFLFIVRVPIIWLMVILSPLAFFAWIFDQSKKYFRQWWSLFMQWAMIAVPASFFLYLSMHTMSQAQNLLENTLANDPSAGLFASIAPYFIALFFMVIGLFMTMKINAAGAGTVIGFARKATLSGTSWASKKGLKGARNVLRRRGPSPEEGEAWEKYKEEHAARATLKLGTTKVGKFLFGGETKEEKATQSKLRKGLKYATRGALGVATLGAPLWARKAKETAQRQIGSRLEEEVSKDISKAQSQTKGKTLATQVKNYRSAVKNTLQPEAEIGALAAIAEDGNFDDAGITKEDLKKTLKKALKVSPSSVAKTLRFIDPKMTQQITEELKLPKKMLNQAGLGFEDKDRDMFEDLAEKLLYKMKESKVPFMSKKAAIGAVTDGAAMRFWKGAHLSKAAAEFGSDFIDAVEQRLAKIADGKTDAESQRQAMQKYNPALAKYLDSNAAHALGFGFGTKEAEKGRGTKEDYIQPHEGEKAWKQQKEVRKHERRAEEIKGYEKHITEAEEKLAKKEEDASKHIQLGLREATGFIERVLKRRTLKKKAKRLKRRREREEERAEEAKQGKKTEKKKKGIEEWK